MGLQLGEALRRICVEVGWSYAVFWRTIRFRGQMCLVWEDGYCERATAAAGLSGFEAMDLLLKERAANSRGGDDLFTEIRHETEDRVGSLVFNMMATQIHFVGDGIIGQAALTGNHQWIFRDSFIDYGSTPKGLAEMYHQFMAGIQTIAIVPVLPHGVVQLGSTQMVMENVGFINHIRILFTQLGCVPGALAPSVTQTSLSRNTHEVPTALNQSGDSDTNINRFSSHGGDGCNHHHVKVQDTTSTVIPSSCSTIAHIYGTITSNASEMPLIMPPSDFSQPISQVATESVGAQVIISNPDSRSIENASPLPRILAGLPSNSLIMNEEELRSASECKLSNTSQFGQTLDSMWHPNSFQMISRNSQLTYPNSIQIPGNVTSEGQQIKESKSSQDLDEFDEQIYSYGSLLGTEDLRASSVPTSGNDLFDLLYHSYKSVGARGSMDDSIANGNETIDDKLITDASTCITQIDTEPVYDALDDEICFSGLFSEASLDQLLGAVVTQTNSSVKQSINESASCKTSLTRINNSPLHTSSSNLGEGLDPSSTYVKSELAASSSVVSACSMESGRGDGGGGYESPISLWFKNSQNTNRNTISAAHRKRIDEGKLNRKRSRPGENPRPRPKDRQMIQDRVKELREIIPNGAKCSIDALLEKTIKHMHFLQSVTKYADKLKEVGESKITSKDGGILLKDNFEGGATWAFEVGTPSMICPIIVEDLNPPRQMLVEMLCEERGLFLEIADLIKGLGLTILKGVMEARTDKVWARFAVEANRDITRMEVFLSLVQLLVPNAGTSNGMENLKMQQNMYRPCLIPATGQPDGSK